MARTLPLENYRWPLTRVLIRQRWVDSDSNASVSSTNWTPLPMMLRPTTNQKGGNGAWVNEWERVALPQIGRAKFTYRFGLIDGQFVGIDPDSAARQRGGKAWDPTVDGTKAPDLTGFEIRIQAAPYVDDVTTAAWRTVWWGECLYQEDRGWPGSKYPAGERIYHCVDGLFRTTRWRLDRHAFAANLLSGGSVDLGICQGHPGYNTQINRASPVLGNRYNQTIPADGGTSVFKHTYPGQGDGSVAYYWTDQQTIEHAVAITRPKREPLFAFKAGTGGLLLFNQTTSVSVWNVAEGDSAFDILARVCRRDRGRGLVFLDWNDDAGAANSSLTVFLRAENQNAFDIKWTDPTPNGQTYVISASTYTTEATANGSIDLIGDHRVVEDLFRVGGKDQFRLDALESCGECIEVLAQLGYRDGLGGTAPDQDGVTIERAWQPAEQATFRGLTTPLKRVDERWRPVYQYHRLPLNWKGHAGTANGGSATAFQRCDYRCDNFGNIVDPQHPGTAPVGDNVAYRTEATSPLLVEFLDSLPLYEGYSYSGTKPVMAGGGALLEVADRRPPMVLIHRGTELFAHMHELGLSAMLEVRHNLIALYEGSDMTNGTRRFSDTSSSGQAAALNPAIDYTDLSFVVGLKMPHRVRFYSGLLPTDPLCQRRARVIHPGLHLWLACPLAAWDLDATTGSSGAGHTPKRAACGAGQSTEHAGILRDDRGRLAQLHAMAASWYLNDRQTLRFGLRDCIFLPSYSAFDGYSIPTDNSKPKAWVYPKLGQIVPQVIANGQTQVVNTPVTRLHYDNDRGVSTCETDWSGLDFVK